MKNNNYLLQGDQTGATKNNINKVPFLRTTEYNEKRMRTRVNGYEVIRRTLQWQSVCVLVLIAISCVFMFAGCSGNKYERKLVGEWYEKGDDRRPAIVFLRDGTFEKEVYNVIREDWYTGVGDWSVEGDQLILSSL